MYIYLMSDENDKEKDIQYKVELLKKALFNEKQKNLQLDKENKANSILILQFEKEINHKNDQIVSLTKEKNEILLNLDCHMHKNSNSNSKMMINNENPIENNENTEDFQVNVDEITKKVYQRRYTTGNNEDNDSINKQTETTINFQPVKKAFSSFISLFDTNSNNNKEEKQEKVNFSTSISNFFSNNKEKDKEKEIEKEKEKENEETENKKRIANYEFTIRKQLTHIDILENRIVDLVEQSNKVKEEYKNIILLQTERIKELDKQVKELKEEVLIKTQASINIVNQNKTYEVLLNNLQSSNKKLVSDIQACQETIKKFDNIIEEKQMMIISLKSNQIRVEEENNSLTKKLFQLKTVMMEEKIRERQFKGMLLEDLYEDNNVNLVFSRTNDNSNVLTIVGAGGLFKDFIYISDIIEMKVGSVQENSIIVKYNIKEGIMIRSIKLVENCNEVIGVYNMFKSRI